jgi:hypothetical protein
MQWDIQWSACKGHFLFYFNQFWFSQYIFLKTPNHVSHTVHMSGGVRADTSGQTDRQTDRQTWWKQWTPSATVWTSLNTAAYRALSKFRNWTISSSVPRTLSLLQQTVVHCSLNIMDVPVKQFLRSPPDFSTYLCHKLSSIRKSLAIDCFLLAGNIIGLF